MLWSFAWSFLLRLSAVADNAAVETEPPKAEPPKRKRRWFQFSLRSLMIFTLICAIGSAWVVMRLKRAERQKSAVEAILKDGGVVWYATTKSMPKGNHIANPERPGPACEMSNCWYARIHRGLSIFLLVLGRHHDGIDITALAQLSDAA